MDDLTMPTDPLQAAIYRALGAGDEVLLMLDEADECEALNAEQSRQAHGLRSRIENGLLVVTCDIATVRALAASLDDGIKRATTTFFVHDECDMSGGYQEEAVTESGLTLMALRTRLDVLAMRLAETKNQLRAAEIAVELRTL
ncbi:MAG: hypothetical protein ACU0B9_19705 [Limimaricola soesokkakensis]|uniref:hypothetical protein n=1 Tax=Limimaricola soesokkakensis TaxID=1343159 RepID=UPI004059138E